MKKRSINCIKDGEIIATYESIMEAERSIGVCPGSINKVIEKNNTSGGYHWEYTNSESKPHPSHLSSVKTNPTKSRRGLSEAELRAKHDNHYKIGKALKSLKKGEFIPESEFIISIGLAGGGYRRWLDSSNYNDYRGKAQGITYYGHPEDIKRMKDETVLI